jgi:hypothetical protein
MIYITNPTIKNMRCSNENAIPPLLQEKIAGFQIPALGIPAGKKIPG